MSADGRRGARSSSERTWRGRRVTSRSVGLPLLGISYLNVRHLLALLVVCRCLGSVQTILTWSPMTELTARALGTHDRNSGGRCWQNIDSKDLAYHRGDSQTPAPAQGRAPDPEPTPPLRVPTAHADSSGRDSRPEAPPVPARHAAGRAPADDEDDVASGSWNDTSLDLAGPALAQAIETLLGLYRSQLLRTDLLTNRELGGKVGGLRRHLSFKPCKTSSGRGGPGELADL